MTDNTNNNSRIAKNTILLYCRMILLMGITLYTSRVVLSTLGVEDFGIYNVVAGFIGMLGFLNSAMSSCTQRYITFALGKGDLSALRNVFSTCIITHVIIAALVFILAETVGLWFVLEKLVIPADRINAALVVYQCSIISALVMILSFPFNATIIAHERMSAFAYISIIEAIAKLVVVYLLLLSDIDKLALYAVLLLVVQCSITSLYYFYCKRNFEETTIRFHFNKPLIKEMFAFTGWNLWGGLAASLFGQGINVLLNVFFGPAVNAARGVSVQVQAAVQQFSLNFQMALNPQITKTYANGDLDSMHTLVFRSAKFTFFLLICLIFPIISEIDPILAIWLKEVPDYTSTFVILMLIITIVDAVSNPFMISAAATGNVKVYQSVIGGLLLLIVPISYIVLRLGAEPFMVFVVHLFVALTAFVVRLLIIRPMISLSIRKYVVNVVVPCVCVSIPTVIIGIFIRFSLNGSLKEQIVAFFLIFLITAFNSFMFGLSKSEKYFILSKIAPFFKR